jgi:hypothetical protein
LEVAREVYEVFRAAEEAAEQSAVALARCTAMLIEARGRAKLPPAAGSEIVQLLARSSGAAFEARHAIVSAHPLLDQLAADLGIVGYGPDKESVPNSPFTSARSLVRVVAEAA